MKRQVASELRKLVSTRSAWAMLAAMLALVAFGVVASIVDNDPQVIRAPLEDQPFLWVPATVAPLFALVLGIRSFVDEFRHGSIVPTLLVTPDRRRVLAGKLVATTAAGVALAAAAFVVAIAVGVPTLTGRGVSISWSTGVMAAMGGRLLGATALWTAIGVGVGLAVRHQVAAIAGALIWVTVGEALIAQFATEIGRYLPVSALASVVSPNSPDLLAPGVAAVVLVGWTLLATVTGGVLMRRRDIA